MSNATTEPLPTSYARDAAPALLAVPMGCWCHLYSSMPLRRRGHGYDGAAIALRAKRPL